MDGERHLDGVLVQLTRRVGGDSLVGSRSRSEHRGGARRKGEQRPSQPLLWLAGLHIPSNGIGFGWAPGLRVAGSLEICTVAASILIQ
jgi:hypothetical protein